MTRINAAIKPFELTDQHLFAEYREIMRIPSVLKKRVESKHKMNDIPMKFTLNAGHVKFFLNKGEYIYKRFFQIIEELEKRGINFSIREPESFEFYKTSDSKTYFNDWEETDIARYLLLDRLNDRINKSKQVPRYYGKDVILDFYKNKMS